jgi:hypothetical protein
MSGEFRFPVPLDSELSRSVSFATRQTISAMTPVQKRSIHMPLNTIHQLIPSYGWQQPVSQTEFSEGVVFRQVNAKRKKRRKS